jgi:hypothetical protein
VVVMVQEVDSADAAPMIAEAVGAVSSTAASASLLRRVCGPALTFTRVAVCGRARATVLEV